MYTIINEENLIFDQLPQNSSLINFSMLRSLESTPLVFRSFSIKYVLEGCENYTINGNRYEVKSGQFLLANKANEGLVEIDSNRLVNAICIDIAPQIIAEVVGSHLRPDTPEADLNLDRFFTTGEFFENKYDHEHTHLGNSLRQLGNELVSAPLVRHDFTQEFYFHLAEQLILDHIPVYKQLHAIGSVKWQTRKDLLRKLHIAKEYIEHTFNSELSMEAVARECGLSEYHFFRLFKAAYGISPHQFLIRKRIEKAQELLIHPGLSISEIAHICGFSDIFTFSKSFKKHTGVSPSYFTHPKK